MAAGRSFSIAPLTGPQEVAALPEARGSREGHAFLWPYFTDPGSSVAAAVGAALGATVAGSGVGSGGGRGVAGVGRARWLDDEHVRLLLGDRAVLRAARPGVLMFSTSPVSVLGMHLLLRSHR